MKILFVACFLWGPRGILEFFPKLKLSTDYLTIVNGESIITAGNGLSDAIYKEYMAKASARFYQGTMPSRAKTHQWYCSMKTL